MSWLLTLWRTLEWMDATLEELGVWLICHLKQFFCWLTELFIIETGAIDFLLDALDLLPSELQTGWAVLGYYYSGVDYWIPVTEGLALWVAYGGFLAVVLTIRTVFRFIPTMS